ncbi:hypothetical protein LINGRAHAP2_LOCUS16750 [Linum grandiflorum]
MIVNYAASHGVQELYLRMRLRDASSGVFGSICACSQSLKVLEVEGIYIEKTDVGLWSRFQLLEALTLTWCEFGFPALATDAFANFPRLETLKLLECDSLRRNCDEIETSVLKVTGPKLLHLEIVSSLFNSLEIVAPNLQSFTLKFNVYSVGLEKIILDASKSNLPSLNRANIELGSNLPLFCANLFKVLHNVQDLTLKVGTYKLLIQTCNLLKRQSSPFQRLKYLNVKSPARRYIKNREEVIDYLRGGSPYKKDMRYTVMKRPLRLL